MRNDPSRFLHRALPSTCVYQRKARAAEQALRRVLTTKGGELLEKLYLSISEAAEFVGVGVSTMREYVNSSDPPPYLKVGKKKLLQRAALADYFEQRQEVRQ